MSENLERSTSQQSLPPIDSPYLVNSSNRSLYGRTTPSQNDRHQLIKLQEQIRSFQEEIEKKDKIIEEMSNFDVKICPERLIESTRRTSSRNFSLDKEELASTKVKIDCLNHKLAELTKDNQVKNNLIETQRRINEELKGELARYKVELEQNSEQLDEMEEYKSASEAIKQRNTILIRNLEDQIKRSQDNLMESRIQVKQLESDLTEAAQDKQELERQLGKCNCKSIEEMAEELKSVKYENECLQHKIAGTEERLKARDCEQQASRQTITRLVAKLSSVESKNQSDEATVSNLKSELEQMLSWKEMKEAEIDGLSCKMVSLDKQIELQAADIASRDQRIVDLQSQIKQCKIEQSNQLNVKDDDDDLKDQLVAIIEECFEPPSDKSLLYDWIIGSVRCLTRERYENTQLNSFDECNKVSASDSTNEVEADLSNQLQSLTIDDLKFRLDEALRNLAAKDVQIEGLSCHKLKYLKVLEELARAMNIDHINQDIGFDMITDALYARANQLQKLECDQLTNQRLAKYNLQKQLSHMKQQLASRDLHLDLLQKKLAAATTMSNTNSSDCANASKSSGAQNKKLERLCEQQHAQIDQLREEVVSLKAKLIDYNRLQMLAMTSDKQISQLSDQLKQLENVRDNQAQMMNKAKLSATNHTQELTKLREEHQQTIESLNSQLKLIQSSLDDSKRKEQQLGELRAVICKLLGLKLDSLAIPDYEVVNRLERLVCAHQSNVFSAYSMQSTLENLNQAFYHVPKTNN